MHERHLPIDAGRTPEPASIGPDESVVVLGVDTAQHAQELLAEHVPLTLLVDLLRPTGETSAELLADEGLPDEPWWSPSTDGDAAGA
ncbi:hypothetical protein [Cellulomonas dongxiuzhuiae]|uniref:Uncharacterized protein n=1 Tax=Cellulomonas dongxiuzhuiae TaxID=2819979 RepID=A0ABX8GMV7_9CELL|nr:hypothetical protein [Cellulomonas dongxiuzhuiae]MBO3087694.1 hypothetical protein [Cellulomonas dongxiuzhuiae]MBO3095946.1 hypothetical protein [Cellulomonas dongxiuzhuiae]QWC17237.1 hypothetical protein KKR89_06515 [Cellulomonas dongxiuzhuiae]